MRTMFTVHHNEHVSSRSFEEVESQVRSREGTSGFMRFLTVDHGAWMARVGLKAKARMYTIGNPLIARTMLEHDIAAGLNVPVRLMIYEEPATRTTRVTYDLPSSLMSGLKNDKVTAAAKKLDARLIALGVHASGVQA